MGVIERRYEVVSLMERQNRGHPYFRFEIHPWEMLALWLCR